MKKAPTVITGTVGMDAHVIGTKVVSRALKDAGFNVVELGMQVTPEEFISVAQETNADAILMTSLYGMAELDSTDSLLNHWGELLVKRGNYQKALTLFSQAIEDVSWVPAYHWNIALTHEHLNQCAKARAHWERYLKLEPDPREHQPVLQHLHNVHNSPTGRCAAQSKN